MPFQSSETFGTAEAMPFQSSETFGTAEAMPFQSSEFLPPPAKKANA
jgi:hypothetical protein